VVAVKLSKGGVATASGTVSEEGSVAGRLGELQESVAQREAAQTSQPQAEGGEGGTSVGAAVGGAVSRVGAALGAGLSAAADRAVKGRSQAAREQDTYEDGARESDGLVGWGGGNITVFLIQTHA